MYFISVSPHCNISSYNTTTEKQGSKGETTVFFHWTEGEKKLHSLSLVSCVKKEGGWREVVSKCLMFLREGRSLTWSPYSSLFFSCVQLLFSVSDKGNGTMSCLQALEWVDPLKKNNEEQNKKKWRKTSDSFLPPVISGLLLSFPKRKHRHDTS